MSHTTEVQLLGTTKSVFDKRKRQGTVTDTTIEKDDPRMVVSAAGKAERAARETKGGVTMTQATRTFTVTVLSSTMLGNERGGSAPDTFDVEAATEYHAMLQGVRRTCESYVWDASVDRLEGILVSSESHASVYWTRDDLLRRSDALYFSSTRRGEAVSVNESILDAFARDYLRMVE